MLSDFVCPNLKFQNRQCTNLHGIFIIYKSSKTKGIFRILILPQTYNKNNNESHSNVSINKYFSFFNRLKINKEQDAVYQCMRHCVKTIFRENFDSAFEHLGKVDGQVTLFNLRNLLFGRYVQPDDPSNPFVEVTGFDQVEKVVAAKVKEHNDANER